MEIKNGKLMRECLTEHHQAPSGKASDMTPEHDFL